MKHLMIALTMVAFIFGTSNIATAQVCPAKEKKSTTCCTKADATKKAVNQNTNTISIADRAKKMELVKNRAAVSGKKRKKKASIR